MLTHNFPSLFGTVNWLQLFTSTSRIYPITRWHSFTVSLSSCCCIFKYDSFSAFSWFMLLYRMPPPPPPHHCPVFAHSPPSSSHQPLSRERVISHQYKDSMGGGGNALQSKKNLPESQSAKDFMTRRELSHLLWQTFSLLHTGVSPDWNYTLLYRHNDRWQLNFNAVELSSNFVHDHV